MKTETENPGTIDRKRAIADIMLAVTYSNAVYGICTGNYPYIGSFAQHELLQKLRFNHGEGLNEDNLRTRGDKQLIAGVLLIRSYLPHARRYYGKTANRITAMQADLDRARQWL